MAVLEGEENSVGVTASFKCLRMEVVEAVPCSPATCKSTVHYIGTPWDVGSDGWNTSTLDI